MYLSLGLAIGHYILDSVTTRLGHKLSTSDRFNGYFVEAEICLNGKPVHLSLFKPKPLMNILGPAVGKACRETVKNPSSMIVIQDDLYREPGSLKIKFGGSPNGHNGIRSITSGLNQNSKYYRLLAGIGSSDDVKSYVLGPLSSYEKQYWSAGGAGTDEVWASIETIAERMAEANK